MATNADLVIVYSSASLIPSYQTLWSREYIGKLSCEYLLIRLAEFCLLSHHSDLLQDIAVSVSLHS